jgi:hypothetical protein
VFRELRSDPGFRETSPGQIAQKQIAQRLLGGLIGLAAALAAMHTSAAKARFWRDPVLLDLPGRKDALTCSPADENEDRLIYSDSDARDLVHSRRSTLKGAIVGSDLQIAYKRRGRTHRSAQQYVSLAIDVTLNDASERSAGGKNPRCVTRTNDTHSVDYIPTLSQLNATPSRVARVASVGSSDGGTSVVCEDGNHVCFKHKFRATHRALDGGAFVRRCCDSELSLPTSTKFFLIKTACSLPSRRSSTCPVHCEAERQKMRN